MTNEELLEHRAREEGCDISDRAAHGARWSFVLIQRIEDAIEAREAKAKIERRRMREMAGAA